MAENPYIPNPIAEIQAMCEAKGITMDSPFIRREYLGEVGVYDSEAMVYNGRTYHEVEDPIPSNLIDYVSIGVDPGFTDYSSVIGLAFSTKLKRGYVFAERKWRQAETSHLYDMCWEVYHEAENRFKSCPTDSIYFYCRLVY
jgi:hypothetical protein